MTEIAYCATGCTSGHLDDCAVEECRGCQPRQADIGILCRRCHGKLVSLVGPVVPIEDAEPHAESVATVALWLADNLGHHLRAPGGDGRSRSESMDRTVTVAATMGDLQIRFTGWAENLREDLGLRHGPRSHDPRDVAYWFRQRLEQAASWAPVTDMITELRETIDEGHAIAPWRPRDRRCVGVACPTCKAKTLLIPAGWVDVWCETCDSTHGRAVYDRITALLAWEAKVEERLTRAGLGVDDLATLTQLHHALEVPRETLREWRKAGALEPVACTLEDRSQLYVAFDAIVMATRRRGA